MSQVFDREKILKLVAEKRWKELIESFKDNKTYQSIKSDILTNQVVENYFSNELLKIESTNNDPDYKYYLQLFIMLHNGKEFHFSFNDADYKKLVLKLVTIEENIDFAYNYAISFPEEEVCKSVIARFNEKKPKVVQHSQSQTISVIENKNLVNTDARISLFKSPQEYQFYRAVLEVFPNFLVIPNVALSAIIEFDEIKNTLTREEKSYFFKTLIDCAVIDTEDNFKSKYLIELDSSFHDDIEQIARDAMKDNILANAGQKLLRVRQNMIDDNVDFVKLIRETLR